jgi:hypothetical protein
VFSTDAFDRIRTGNHEVDSGSVRWLESGPYNELWNGARCLVPGRPGRSLAPFSNVGVVLKGDPLIGNLHRRKAAV